MKAEKDANKQTGSVLRRGTVKNYAQNPASMGNEMDIGAGKLPLDCDTAEGPTQLFVFGIPFTSASAENTA